MAQETRHFPLFGGLDLVTPAIAMPPGRAIGCANYEGHPKGYARIGGFERLDGRPKPSEASYWVLNFDAGSVAVVAGDVVTGGTSGATARALLATLESGSYAGSDAAGFLVLTALVGVFQDNESLEVGGNPVATADGVAIELGAGNDEDSQAWLQLAQEDARSLIQKPAGSGPIRGVWVYGGAKYAFRDNVGASACVMHKATAAGWVAQDLGVRVSFTNGVAEINEGDTVTGLTSGASGVVTRVALRSGDWGSVAAGQLIFASITGAFITSEALQVGGVTKADSNSASTANTLPAGGRYEFRNHNFFGASNLRRMYGVNGVGTGFEWDGSVFVPIITTMSPDTPKHLAVHQNHLFLAYPGGSLQHSGIGAPYAWSVVLGAGEIGLGEEITGLLEDVVGVLTIFGRNRVAVLYGASSADWELKGLADEAGGVEWTVQKIGAPVYMDDRGLRDLRATQAFGDFRVGTLTQLVEPLFTTKRKAGVAAVASLRVRAKDQYRLFWDDGTGLTVYFGRKMPECMPFDLGVTVKCVCSSEEADGAEVLLMGDEDGWVYQLDAGPSFDGQELAAFARLPFNHVGAPTQEKRWHGAGLECDAGAGASIGLLAEFTYGDPEQPAQSKTDFDIAGGGGFWDEMIWDEFFWDSPVNGTAWLDIDGLGVNMSLCIVSAATYEDPHVLHGVSLHFSPRKLRRGGLRG